MTDDPRTRATRVAAIVAIAGLDALALALGHNGILMATAFALIAGIAGYEVGVERVRNTVSGGGGSSPERGGS